MKKTILTTLLVAMVLHIFAQQETLFSKSNAFGAFGGPIVEFGSIAGDYSVSSGGGGGIIIDNFFIGGYGLGASDFENLINGNEYAEIDIAHGGIWLGYNLKSYKVIHPYSSLKVGWGGVDFRIDDNNLDDWDSIFALTPEVGLELNVTKFFHIAASVGYRWVNGVNESNLNFNNDDFRNVNGSLAFRFGWFGGWKNKDKGDYDNRRRRSWDWNDDNDDNDYEEEENEEEENEEENENN